MVPESAFALAITPRSFRVYTAICLFADRQTGECHPRDEQIGEVSGIAVRKVRESVAELVAAGAVERSGSTHKRTLTVTAFRPHGGPKVDAPQGAYTCGPTGGLKGQVFRPKGGLKFRPPHDARAKENRPLTDQPPLPPTPGTVEAAEAEGGRGGKYGPPVGKDRLRELAAEAHRRWGKEYHETEYMVSAILESYPESWCEAAMAETAGMKLYNPPAFFRKKLAGYVQAGGPSKAMPRPTQQIPNVPPPSPPKSRQEREREAAASMKAAEEAAAYLKAAEADPANPWNRVLRRRAADAS